MADRFRMTVHASDVEDAARKTHWTNVLLTRPAPRSIVSGRDTL